MAIKAFSTNGALAIGIGSVLPTTQHQQLHIREFYFTVPSLHTNVHSRYAPAYERYGSQINAIHFIGPNKPWKSIPFRSPFLAEKRPAPEPRSSQQAYDYESLVDRWFAVYDKHYRSQPLTAPPFEVKRYLSAWDSPSSGGSFEADSGRPFSLEDLRRIAIEGMTTAGLKSSSLGGRPGEGEYRSMPLEGRFDLMRPKKVHPESEKDPVSTPASSLPEPTVEKNLLDTDRELPMTPISQHLDLPDDPPRWHTLPTPGPNEVPPSPKFRLKSLPPTPTPAPDYYASSAGQTSDSDAFYSVESPVDQANQAPSHLFSQSFPPQQSLPRSDSHGEPMESQHHHHHHHHHNLQHQHPHRHHTEDPRHQQAQHQHGFPFPEQGSVPRPSSPPLISWNPAVEPPPNDPPPPSGFPADTYFTNVWDETRSQSSSHTQKGSPGQPSEFFQAPPPPQIPEALRTQGHYRNVTGEAATGSTPGPDRSKVKPVFPWEDKPRQMPRRVFPESDAPSPTHFIKPKPQTSPTIPPTTAPKAPERKPLKRSPVSPPGLPTSLNYSNAWDNVPSIQNYASRLVRPSPSDPAPAPTFDGSGRRKGAHERSWDEKVEASSRDGDDEDEGDEDENAREADSDDDRVSRQRSHSASSIVEDTRQVQKSAQKFYRSRGVQTIPREKRSQGVQVSVIVEPPSRDKSRRSSLSSKRSVASGSSASPLPSREVNHTPESLPRPGASPTFGSIRPRSTSNGSVGRASPLDPVPRPHRDFITSPSSLPQRPPTKPITSRAPETSKASTPSEVGTSHKSIIPQKAPAPPRASTPARPSIQTGRHILHPTKAPSIASRQISNDSSVGSPPSSVGPVSPRDDQPFTASPLRKGTRVWDPARGVELFKRGSEEVLARFLKMGSWDESTR